MRRLHLSRILTVMLLTEQLQYLREKNYIVMNASTITILFCIHVPVFIDPMDCTILGMPVIGATIPALIMPSGCVGIDCAILKAIGTGVVFKGAIGAID